MLSSLNMSTNQAPSKKYVVELGHPFKSRSLKEQRFPSPCGDIVNLEHLLKSSCVKEVRFSNRSGNVVKFEHSIE